MTMMTEPYEVRGCAVQFGDVVSWPLNTQEDIDRATWFAVYKNERDGQQCVADFYEWHKAQAFAGWLSLAPSFVSNLFDIRINPVVGDAAGPPTADAPWSSDPDLCN